MFYALFILIVAAVILCVIALIRHASKQYMRDSVRNICGPYSIPWLGSLHAVYKINYKNVFTTTDELVLQYGSIVKMWTFNRLAIFCVDPEVNEQLLTSNVHITKHRTYDILHQWLGVGLLVSDGKKWHSRRKIITPTLHFKILEEFLEVFDRQSSVMLNCLEKSGNETSAAFDIYPFMCLLTLDIITETAMGTKVKAQTDTDMPYTSAVKEMTTLMAWRFLRVHLHDERIFSFMYPHKKLRQIQLNRIMHKFTRSVIEKRRRELEEQLIIDPTTNDELSDTGVKKRMALLDLLLQATIDGKPLTDEDIREEVDTFMFEGHDTTTSALSFTLYLLSRHSQVQNELFNEIREIYPEGNSPKFSLMNLNELKYMECVIKESLRLYPSVPFIAREIREDFKYEHSVMGTNIIPAGTELLISLYGMMRNPTLFANPTEFRPERHEHNEMSSSFNFVPFSAGPRNCIGQKFAMYEMKVILVKILQNYELLPLGDEVKPVLNIIMRSESGMQLGIRKRLTC